MEFTKAHARYPEKKGFLLHRYTADEFIFIHFLSPATIVIQGKKTDVPTGACIFFPTQADYVLSSPNNDLVHDWFHAKGNVVELLAQYGMRFETLYCPSGHEFITETVAAIEAERSMKYPYADRLCSLMGEELIAKIARFCTLPQDPAVAPELYRALCDVREQLHTAFSESWTVERMAAAINLSPSYFHSSYRSAFGISPKHDLLSIRLQHAKSLLRHSNLNITDIATRVGFGSSFHFIRSFKSAFGVTPNQYRLSKKS